MAERLNAIAYAHHMSNPDSASYDPNFNPRSVSFDVRTPQELAAVNEFLITLGRDVAQGGGGGNQRRPHHLMSQRGSDEFSYFDAANLSQMGLAGMPGMPGSGASYSDTGLPLGLVVFTIHNHTIPPIQLEDQVIPQYNPVNSHLCIREQMMA
jgi:hypothetical protein